MESRSDVLAELREAYMDIEELWKTARRRSVGNFKGGSIDIVTSDDVAGMETGAGSRARGNNQ